MDIIARFPRLPPLDDVAQVASHPESHRPPPGVATPRPQPMQPTPSRRRPTFPTASVALLAAVAVVAWSLVAWHESVRFAGQQRPDRLALQPPSGAQPAVATPTP
jgi:hypothetical protein